MFLERKIMGRMKGEMGTMGGGAAGQTYSDFLTHGGMTDLKVSGLGSGTATSITFLTSIATLTLTATLTLI